MNEKETIEIPIDDSDEAIISDFVNENSSTSDTIITEDIYEIELDRPTMKHHLILRLQKKNIVLIALKVMIYP